MKERSCQDSRALGAVSAGFFFKLSVMIVFVLCFHPAQAAESGTDKRPILQMPLAGSAPVIDGKLDELCWENAAKTDPLKVMSGQASGASTRVFLSRDAAHLYVGVQCDCAKAEREVGKESLELLIDSNGDENSFYLIGITDRKNGFISSYSEQDPHWIDVTWRPAFTFATAGTEKGWAAEFKLPFAIFSKNKVVATEIGFDLKRSGMASNEVHGWQGGFIDVAASGILKGIPALSNVPGPEYSTAAISGGRKRFVRTLNKAGRDFLAKEGTQTLQLGPGSSHPCTTGEVTLELEKMLMAGSPHARGIIWDLAVDKDKGELYVLADTRLVRGVAEVRVFDRKGQYLRTIMPVNPTVPSSNVQDICRKTARENGVDSIIPKHFLSWGEPSMYGEWWHHPQKLAPAPNGDLIMANLYKGILWRLKPDGSFPADGWTSAYNQNRNEPVESTTWTKDWWFGSGFKNHLPFHALHYPYFCFGPNGLLYMSAGQSSHPTRRYAYHYEVGENHVDYQWPEDGERGSYVWKCRLKPGPKVEKSGVVGGFAEASGVVVEGNHLIVADAGHNRLQVLTVDGETVASITHYEDEGKRKPLYGPTALAMDHNKNIYVLIGSEERREDARSERSLNSIRSLENAAAKAPPEPPRRLIKLRSWRRPELLAVSEPLHPDTLQIAVDAGVTPALVWVANAAGPGNLQQLSGDDLSLKGEWQDRDETLSNPRQSGDQPILNIDPETGHLYVEDDSNYRLKQYGTVYRLDQQGLVQEKWEPFFFDAVNLDMLSPWGRIDYKRHFRYPEEPLFIDSIFGKDGRVYRFKLDTAGVSILRFDRAGEPIRFESTGTNALFVEPHIKFTHWWDVYNGMDVDRQGNIYYVAKVDSARQVDAYAALHRQINMYDSRGNLRKKGLLVLDTVRGIQVDADGNLYALHRPVERPWEDYVAISKFAPSGGKPLWTRRWDGNPGWSHLANPPCHCSTTRFHQTLDGKGYLYAAGKYSVQVIRCDTGQLVGEFGSYGNMDCQGKGSRFPHPELPFGAISGLSVWKDRLFVLDEVNRRIVKCRIVYDSTKKKVREEQ